MEEGQRRKEKLERMIENCEESIMANKIIKELIVLRELKGNDLETRLKSCDKAIEDDEKYKAELETLLAK